MSVTSAPGESSVNEVSNRSGGDPEPRTGTTDWQQYARFRGRIIHREPLARHTHVFTLELPDGFRFTPGQGVQLTIDREGHREQKQPMFLTGLSHERRLEIFVHDDQADGSPNHTLVHDCPVGTRLLFSPAEDFVRYQSPGVFIAAGAGIAAFASILRHLNATEQVDGHRLFLINDRREDVVLQAEWFRYLGPSVTSTLTEEEHRDFEHGTVDREWLEKRVDDFNQPFYVCGPPELTERLEETIQDLGGEVQVIKWPGSK